MTERSWALITAEVPPQWLSQFPNLVPDPPPSSAFGFPPPLESYKPAMSACVRKLRNNNAAPRATPSGSAPSAARESRPREASRRRSRSRRDPQLTSPEARGLLPNPARFPPAHSEPAHPAPARAPAVPAPSAHAGASDWGPPRPIAWGGEPIPPHPLQQETSSDMSMSSAAHFEARYAFPGRAAGGRAGGRGRGCHVCGTPGCHSSRHGDTVAAMQGRSLPGASSRAPEPLPPPPDPSTFGAPPPLPPPGDPTVIPHQPRSRQPRSRAAQGRSQRGVSVSSASTQPRSSRPPAAEQQRRDAILAEATARMAASPAPPPAPTPRAPTLASLMAAAIEAQTKRADALASISEALKSLAREQ